ncbi:MAG: hypothetical protein Q7S11_00430 [bacterium]|nr:hypothetical protein [bacterium]
MAFYRFGSRTSKSYSKLAELIKLTKPWKLSPATYKLHQKHKEVNDEARQKI